MKTKGFVCIECILYVIFILLDCFFPAMGRASMDIKYAGIVLCFFYVICLLPKEKMHSDAMIVRTAMAFTLLADTFLVKLGNNLAGVACFILVQMCYFYRLNRKRLLSILYNIAAFLLVYVAFNLTLMEVGMLMVLSQFYILSLVRNVFDSFLLSKNRRFQTGLVLFLLCDISVGLFNLPDFLSLPEWYEKYIYPVVSVSMWACYLPSQVLICLSIQNK